MVLEGDFGDNIQTSLSFVLGFGDFIFNDLLVSVDDELLVKWRLVLLSLGQFLKGLLSWLHFIKQEEGIGNSQWSVVGKLLDAIEVHLVEQLDEESVLLVQGFVIVEQSFGQSAVLDNLLLEWAILLVTGLLVDFDVTIKENGCISVGWLPWDKLQDISDLVLDFLTILEFVDVDEQEVDSVISVGDNDQDDEWNTNNPSNDWAFEESVFHDFGENQHHGSPQIDGSKGWPELSNDFVIVGAVEVELHEQDCGTSQDESQQDVLVLVTSHEGEAGNHDKSVEEQQEVGSGVHSGWWVIGGASTLVESEHRDEWNDWEDYDSKNGNNTVKDVNSAPANLFGEEGVDIVALGIINAVDDWEEIVGDGDVKDGCEEPDNDLETGDWPWEGIFLLAVGVVDVDDVDDDEHDQSHQSIKNADVDAPGGIFKIGRKSQVADSLFNAVSPTAGIPELADLVVEGEVEQLQELDYRDDKCSP